mmetsp:Transcript_39029/g.97318  ORF Transcript_39029/g.97318 Transcript_39029/m.97318 type:complete len:156 (-) Transcript_39029:1185-1652(-)
MSYVRELRRTSKGAAKPRAKSTTSSQQATARALHDRPKRPHNSSKGQCTTRPSTCGAPHADPEDERSGPSHFKEEERRGHTRPDNADHRVTFPRADAVPISTPQWKAHKPSRLSALPHSHPAAPVIHDFADTSPFLADDHRTSCFIWLTSHFSHL